MNRTLCQLLSFVLLIAWSCMGGACSDPADAVASITGEYFAENPEMRAAFHIEGDDTAAVMKLLDDLEPTADMKWQGAAAFTIAHQGGRERKVEVTTDNAVRIDGKAFKADTQAILDVIRQHIKQQ